ncbi:hypothetical protein HPT27_03765 [Permianibacter sp. IMCC34836]|uniref:SPOR domain-containing protein n=1 Tax=Permianibacter fluminis TaxID=2738515 RepID=UPI0015540318|nr:SPOR domain-containing protein [Permianibacter fluminis]NQD36128.1 hypothetical protein [Permianibacter fluminis]
MAQRDYAKNKGKSKSSSGGNTTFRVLLIGLIIGFALGFGSHWWFADTFSNAKELVAHAKSVGTDKATPEPVTGTKPDKKAADSKYKPLKVDPQTEAEWSFQELLEEKTEPAANPGTGNKAVASAAKPIVMGCAAFSGQDKAETMKAQIAFAGLQADVKPVTNQAGARLYRVQLGPYANKRDAESDKRKLEEAGINTCKIW